MTDLDSRWRPVRLLLEAVDQQIASIYADAGVDGMRTRFVGPLIQLGRRGAMTVRELADSVEVTHSAMSQTVAAMRSAGFVADAANSDGRTRRVQLSERGRAAIPLLEAEWRATEDSLAELEAEVPYPLTQVVADLAAALAKRSFRERLDAHLNAR
ncbi:DNA-binding MarR family transcriptional regulator [Hamadaea flava]|uniref:MarR family transcriptional regulator n=1 Tax=Hamadaea flava TaxID=1742688 RepID=A0ABV8LLJ0_9ACTN|nr:MarR family transcriptional regulator [Hamadaea flava]MCP2323912.1 DNA-binding MarR family transcriptional regulator [Hamadaea flava]